MGKRIEVNITSQQLMAYENKKLVYSFPCITGDASHPTPKGKYKIISKHRIYRSKKYDAQMNYALRITSDGIFIHEGYNYIEDPVKQTRIAAVLSDTTANVVSFARKSFPDIAKKNITVGNINVFGSHGCIRVAHSDAVKLFDWAIKDMLVEIK
jgi:lipoprotein-anchoring transpeptidase ErfK/SrfK